MKSTGRSSKYSAYSQRYNSS